MLSNLHRLSYFRTRQVTTEQDLVSRAIEFQGHLRGSSLADFCSEKAAAATDAAAIVDAEYWSFLGAHFSPNPRDRWLELLGFGEGVIATKAADLKRGIAEGRRSKGVSAKNVREVSLAYFLTHPLLTDSVCQFYIFSFHLN